MRTEGVLWKHFKAVDVTNRRFKVFTHRLTFLKQDTLKHTYALSLDSLSNLYKNHEICRDSLGYMWMVCLCDT